MALEFARRGYDLGISARREAVLNELREEILTFAQVDVKIYPLDASDVTAVQATLPKVRDDFGRLDIVIANAGLAKESSVGYGDFNNVTAMVDLNITGTFATIDSAVRIFREQGFGHIVALGSVAGERGLPSTPAYSASKAAVAVYMDALRASEHRKKRFDITLLCPGYIDTPLNRDMPLRPFVIPVEKGGKLLVNKIIAKRKKTFVPSMPWALIAPIIRNLPTGIIGKLFR
jgi:short-subunit dehydrogenase